MTRFALGALVGALTAAEMNGKLYDDISDPITAMQVLVALEAPVRQLVKAVLA